MCVFASFFRAASRAIAAPDIYSMFIEHLFAIFNGLDRSYITTESNSNSYCYITVAYSSKVATTTIQIKRRVMEAVVCTNVQCPSPNSPICSHFP